MWAEQYVEIAVKYIFSRSPYTIFIYMYFAANREFNGGKSFGWKQNNINQRLKGILYSMLSAIELKFSFLE